MRSCPTPSFQSRCLGLHSQFVLEEVCEKMSWAVKMAMVIDVHELYFQTCADRPIQVDLDMCKWLKQRSK